MLVPGEGRTGVTPLPGDVTNIAACFVSALIVKSLLCPHRGNSYLLLQQAVLVLLHFVRDLAVTAGCHGVCCRCCWWQGLGHGCPPGTVTKTRGCFTPCAHALVDVKQTMIQCLFLGLPAVPRSYITSVVCLQVFPWCAFILAVSFDSLSLKHEFHTSKGDLTPSVGLCP